MLEVVENFAKGGEWKGLEGKTNQWNGTIEWNKVNAAVVCILTHGDDHALVYGVDSHSFGLINVPAEPSVELRELISKLNPKKCPDLDDKPKLFFIQACRGDRGGLIYDFIVFFRYGRETENSERRC